jgi:hypothetical protein
MVEATHKKWPKNESDLDDNEYELPILKYEANKKQKNKFFGVLKTPRLQQLCHRAKLGFFVFIHRLCF